MTNKLQLTPLSVAHADFLLELMLTPDYQEFIGDRGVHNLEQAQAYIETYFLPQVGEPGLGYYILSNESGEIVGIVGLLQRDFLDYPDLGFATLPNFYRRGYTLAGCRELLERVRKERSLPVVEAFTNRTNLASQALLNKLGFKHVGEIIHPQTDETLMRYQLQM